MHQMARRTAIRAVVMAVALSAPAACSPSSANRAGPTATVATDPPQTTTTNPYAVPAVIDAAYVNRVLAGLDAAMGDVLRTVVRTRTIPRDSYDRLRAIYATDGSLQLAIDLLQNDIRRSFAGYSAEPGNQVTMVSELISARSGCVFARIRRDYSAIGPGASATSDQNWIALRPSDKGRDPGEHNIVGWSITYEGFPANRSQPPNQCAV